MLTLPTARGPLSSCLLGHLGEEPHPFEVPVVIDDALAGDDFHLSLYLCYELHYRGVEGVHDGWEWEPSLLGFRRGLESTFEEAVRREVGDVDPPEDVAHALKGLAASDEGPSLASYLQTRATLEECLEFLIHRSAYHLKEADPHTWAIPRLEGLAKAAMVEIQMDEYGGGDATRMHASLFARTLAASGLDPTYGAYVDVIPGVTLATVNLMTMFGLHRRLRGATVGHLAMFEMTSTSPNRKYAQGLRRLGLADATDFFDEHVEADAVHEEIAAHDLAGTLAREEPALAADIVFGARALLLLDRLFAEHVLSAWGAGASSLLAGERVTTAP
ncbi:MAG TPA: iron-containing redox enzyme family protein [Actinomycetota bacterium]|nr:iron-containing redox enzyme family protein [Actinomycetota bacterium]